MLEDKYVNGRGHDSGRAAALLHLGKLLIERLQIHRPGVGHHLHHGDRWVFILSSAEEKD